MSSDQARLGRAVAMLSVGIAVSGAMSYLYFAIASHALSASDYGEVAVLWSALFISVFTLYRPIEQLVSRSVAEHEAHGASARPVIRLAALIQAAVAAGFVVVALLLRGPITDELFGGSEALYVVLVVSAPIYAVSFLARGYLAGSGRFGLYGAMLVLESGARLCAPLAVAVGLGGGQALIAFGLAAAPVVSLLVMPAVILARRPPSQQRPVTGPGPDAGVATTGTLAVGLFAMMAGEQILLNLGPLAVRVGESAAAAGVLFNALLIARVPQVVFGAFTTSLLPTLTRIRAEFGDGPEFARPIRAALRGVGAFTAAALVAVLAAGPDLMGVAFGDAERYGRADLAIVTVGMGAYLAALTLNQAAISRGQVRPAAAGWLLCASGFAVVALLPVFDDVRRVEVAFSVAMALVSLSLARLYRAGNIPAGRAS